MMREPIKQRRRHLWIAKDARPFSKIEIGSDDDRRAFIKSADQMEQELAASQREGQIAKLIEDDKIQAAQAISDPALPFGARFGFQLIDEIDDIEEPTAGAFPDQGAGDGNGEMGFAGSCAADKDDVALQANKGAGRQVANQRFVDGRSFELKIGKLFGQRHFGNRHLVLDRSGALFIDLGFEQIRDDLLDRVLTFEAIGDDVVKGPPHAVKLQGLHQVQDVVTFHKSSSKCRSGRNRRPVCG